MGGTEFVFEPPESHKLPFLIKTLKAVLKSFDENDAKAFTSLKEYKLFGVFAPSKMSTVPEASNLSDIFKAKHLKADSPSFLLKDTFDKIPQNLSTRSIMLVKGWRGL